MRASGTPAPLQHRSPLRFSVAASASRPRRGARAVWLYLTIHSSMLPSPALLLASSSRASSLPRSSRNLRRTRRSSRSSTSSLRCTLSLPGFRCSWLTLLTQRPLIVLAPSAAPPRARGVAAFSRSPHRSRILRSSRLWGDPLQPGGIRTSRTLPRRCVKPARSTRSSRAAASLLRARPPPRPAATSRLRRVEVIVPDLVLEQDLQGSQQIPTAALQSVGASASPP